MASTHGVRDVAAWPDSSAGLHTLKEQGFVLATLSNGTVRLLIDLVCWLVWLRAGHAHRSSCRQGRTTFLGTLSLAAISSTLINRAHCICVTALLTNATSGTRGRSWAPRVCSVFRRMKWRWLRRTSTTFVRRLHTDYAQYMCAGRRKTLASERRSRARRRAERSMLWWIHCWSSQRFWRVTGAAELLMHGDESISKPCLCKRRVLHGDESPR
jgi:hypothetical protein